MPRKTITPFESFTLIPSEHTLPSYGSFTQRTPILSIYSSSATTSEKATSSPLDKPKPLYTIILPRHTSLFVPSWWPWTTNPTISLHDGSFNQNSFPSVSSTSPAASKRATISDLYFAAHFCSVGTVSSVTADPPLRSSTSQPPNPTSSPSPSISDDLTISSGLGHGQWYDTILPTLLGTSPAGSDKNINGRRIIGQQQPEAIWHASPTGWGYEDSNFGDVEWNGLGRPRDGAIMVTDKGGEGEGEGEGVGKWGRDRIVAIYVPRGSSIDPSAGKGSEKGAPGVGGGSGIGGLGICIELEEKKREEVVKHLLTVAVGIEEQILRCRGFRGAYHGGWAHVPKAPTVSK